MRIRNISLSKTFNSKEQVLNIVRFAEKKMGTNLELFINEICFVAKPLKINEEICTGAYLPVHKTIKVMVRKDRSDEIVVLLHELYHAKEHKERVINYYQTKSEFKAEDFAILNSRSKKLRARWEDIKKHVQGGK